TRYSSTLAGNRSATGKTNGAGGRRVSDRTRSADMPVTVRGPEVAQVLARGGKAARARSAQASLPGGQGKPLFGAPPPDRGEPEVAVDGRVVDDEPDTPGGDDLGEQAGHDFGAEAWDEVAPAAHDPEASSEVGAHEGEQLSNEVGAPAAHDFDYEPPDANGA